MRVNHFFTHASFAELVGVMKRRNTTAKVSSQRGVQKVQPLDKFSEESIKEELEFLGFGWWHF